MENKRVEVKIIKKRDDPLGITRVSLGLGEGLGDGTGFCYCVYRGSKEEALLCLQLALRSMKIVVEELGEGIEPDIAPDDGKQYA